MTNNDIKKPQTELISDLSELLLEGRVTTQENICHTLELLGHNVNQSKISRLLRKLGAAKSKNEQGHIVYRLPREPAPPTAISQLCGLIRGTIFNETTIVVNVSPGSAQLIARIIDYNHDKLDILGCIAGDDTIIVIPKSIKKIKTVVDKVKTLLLK